MAEWLRRQIRNLVGFARVGSNPTGVAIYISNIIICAFLAEWSKALRLGRSIFGCVGSNPTECKLS